MEKKEDNTNCFCPEMLCGHRSKKPHVPLLIHIPTARELSSPPKRKD